MKKIILGIATAALVVSIGTASAFAATPNNKISIDSTTTDFCYYHNTAHGFIDQNQDGICDYRDTYHRTQNSQQQMRNNYTDRNGDGVCDYSGTGHHRNGNGRHCRNV